MKKFFIALSVLAALMLSVVPSQAIMGVADTDALGTDAIVPFITDLDYTGRTGLNTLFVFTDVKGASTTATTASGFRFHYTVYTQKSVTVYDDNLKGTPYDILPTDAYTIIAKLSPTYRDDLLVDLDGDGTMDHYAGYIWFDNTSDIKNTAGGQFLFVDLAKGIAASANIPMKEVGTTAFLATPVSAQMEFGDIELFSPNGLRGAQALQDGSTALVDAANFGIYPRYYIAASGDATWLMFWMSSNASVGTPATVILTNPLHVNWYDNEENYVSTNIPIPWEFTIIDVEPLIPESLFPAATYPKEGWIDLTWAVNADNENLEMLGWTFLQAYGAIGSQNTSWGVLNPMWRWVD